MLHVYQVKKLHPSGLLGILNVIPKPGKDSTLLTNLRPITLLNTDYKLIKKVICNRITPVLQDIIHHDQTGFMKNRRISVNIRKLLDIMNLTDDQDMEAFVLSLDCSKAFDKLSFCAIKGSLQYFEFPEYIVDWIGIMYTGFKIKVQNNGKFSNEININRGIHQGGVCSAALFVLGVETLANLLRSDPEVEGIPVGQTIATLNQFADDMDVFSLFKQTSLDAILNNLKLFYYSSGMEINYNKTTLYRIGSLKSSNAMLYTQENIKWSNEDIVVLGVTVSHDQDSMLRKNYSPIITKCSSVLQGWSSRGLSLFGRIVVVNTLIASLFIYKFAVLPNLPSNMLRQVNSIISAYLWNNKKAKIALHTLQLSKKSGGAGLVNLKWREMSIKSSWLQILHSDEKAAQVAYQAIGSPLKQDIWWCNVHMRDVQCVTQGMTEFWKDVFVAWFKLSYDRSTNGNHQLLWCNSYIRVNNQPILWDFALKRGLQWVRQLFPEGKLISNHHAWEKYSLTYLHVFQLVNAIPAQWRMDVCSAVCTTDLSFVDVCLAKGKLANYLYSLLNAESDVISKRWSKWQSEIGHTCLFSNYQSAMRNVYITTNVPKLRSFQFRLLHRALPTNISLKRWGLCDTEMCTWCGIKQELYKHFFFECEKVTPLWEEILQYSSSSIQENKPISVQSVLFDCVNDKRGDVINYLSLVTKYFIYVQRCLGKELSVVALRNKISYYKNMEKFIATKNNNLRKFYSKWEPEAEIDDWADVDIEEYVNQYLENNCL